MDNEQVEKNVETPKFVTEPMKKSDLLNERIKELLLYVGFAASIISALAYIIITIVMVNGFTSAFDVENQIVFSVLGAIVGLSITISLRLQGVAFAKREPNSQVVMKDYYTAINKTKKAIELHMIDYYMKRAIVRDIFIKGTIVMISTFFILYIFIEGNGNWSLVGLALANILMFAGFGLIALSSSYDKYIEEHLAVVIELTNKINEERKPKKVIAKKKKTTTKKKT